MALRAAHGGFWSFHCSVSMDLGRSVKLYHLLCAEIVSALREPLRAVGTQAPNVVLQAFGDVSVRPGWARKRGGPLVLRRLVLAAWFRPVTDFGRLLVPNIACPKPN